MARGNRTYVRSLRGAEYDVARVLSKYRVFSSTVRRPRRAKRMTENIRARARLLASNQNHRIGIESLGDSRASFRLDGENLSEKDEIEGERTSGGFQARLHCHSLRLPRFFPIRDKPSWLTREESDSGAVDRQAPRVGCASRGVKVSRNRKQG